MHVYLPILITALKTTPYPATEAERQEFRDLYIVDMDKTALPGKELEELFGLLQQKGLSTLVEDFEIYGTGAGHSNWSRKWALVRRLPENIATLTSLKTLKLDSTELPELPESIGELKMLRELHVSNNFLKTLPLTLANCTELRSISVNNNTLLDRAALAAPIEAMLQNSEALLAAEMKRIHDEMQADRIAREAARLAAGDPEAVRLAAEREAVTLARARQAEETARLAAEEEARRSLVERFLAERAQEAARLAAGDPDTVRLVAERKATSEAAATANWLTKEREAARSQGSGGLDCEAQDLINALRDPGYPATEAERARFNTLTIRQLSREKKAGDEVEELFRLLHQKGLSRLVKKFEIIGTGKGTNPDYHDNYSAILKRLPENIDSLTSLETLKLRYNDLEELPASIGNLRMLAELDLEHNCLKTLPSTLVNCTKLKKISVEENPLDQSALATLSLVNTVLPTLVIHFSPANAAAQTRADVQQRAREERAREDAAVARRLAPAVQAQPVAPVVQAQPVAPAAGQPVVIHASGANAAAQTRADVQQRAREGRARQDAAVARQEAAVALREAARQKGLAAAAEARAAEAKARAAAKPPGT